MENKSIHEFTTGVADNGSLFLVDTPDISAESGYTTEKLPLSDVGSKVVNGISYTQDVQTESKNVSGAINELLTYVKNIAEDYDDTSTYAVGDYVLYQATLYKCTTAVSVAESFDPTKWSAVLVVDELGSGGGGAVIDDTTTALDKVWSSSHTDSMIQQGVQKPLASAYDASVTYSMGDYVYYDGRLFRSLRDNNTNNTPEIGSSYWKATVVGDELEDIAADVALKQNITDNTLDTTAKTVVGAINEVNSAVADFTTVKTISASDFFDSADLSKIDEFYAYRVGNIVFVERLKLVNVNLVSPTYKIVGVKPEYLPSATMRLTGQYEITGQLDNPYKMYFNPSYGIGAEKWGTYNSIWVYAFSYVID